MSAPSSRRRLSLALWLSLALCSLAPVSRLAASGRRPAAPLAADGIHKIKHVVVIMQENRSFDSYFGTYPGADGLPRDAQGNPNACIPDPNAGHCAASYHDPSLTNAGGPHYKNSAQEDIDGGKMDGFVKVDEASGIAHGGDLDTNALGCTATLRPPGCVDVMGYHDQREIPNYWTYAKNFVLQDHMFEPIAPGASSHLFMVSGWSALCPNSPDASSCVSDNTFPDGDGVPVTSNPLLHQITGAAVGILQPADADDLPNSPQPPDFAWTDITYLLYKHHVSWGYYVPRHRARLRERRDDCTPVPQVVSTPEIWNPLPDFATVHQDNQLGNIQTRTTSSPPPRTARCRRSRGWSPAATTPSTRRATSSPARSTSRT